jgi:hypothetical protein
MLNLSWLGKVSLNLGLLLQRNADRRFQPLVLPTKTLAAMSNSRTGDQTPNQQITEMDSSTTASCRVFGTYELLEAIILALPVQDVFLVAQVNTTWYSIVITFSATHKRLRKGEAFKSEQNPYSVLWDPRQCFMVIQLREADPYHPPRWRYRNNDDATSAVRSTSSHILPGSICRW